MSQSNGEVQLEARAESVNSIERRVRVPSGEMLVRDAASKSTASPLLLIHGFGESSLVWEPMMERLTEARRVLRIGLLGHGESDKPDTSYEVPEQARSVLAILDELSIDRVHLVAHSAGGDVAVSMIEQSRDRFESAVFLGTAPDLKFVHKSLSAKLMLIPGLGTAMWAVATDEMVRDGLKKAFAPSSAAPPEIYVRSLRQMTYRSYSRCLRQVERFKAERNLCARMKGKDISTLVVFGSRDRWVDPSAAKMWEEAGSRIRILDAIGHTHMTEAPAETAELVLNFASGVELGVSGAAQRP